MAEAITTLHLIRRGRTAASARNEYLRSGLGAREALRALGNELVAVASGALDGKAILRVDGSEAAAATGSVVVESDDTTAGDKLIVRLPGFPAVSLAAVATAAEVTSGDGTWSLETATDTAKAQSLRDAINNHHLLGMHVTATESSGTVTLTADVKGSEANSITLAKDVTTAGALTITAMSGGTDAGARPTETITFNTDTNALANNDTIAIGAVTFTWKTSGASGENQINYANVDATDAAALATAVNAHSKLEGLISASAATGVCTLTWLTEPRMSQLVSIVKSETNSGAMTLSNAAFTPATTETYGETAPAVYSLGAA